MAAFKVDENLPVELTDALRAAGHDALSVLDQGLGGAEDPDVASVCRRENRILMTLDLGFGDIRSYRPGQHAGIVVLRPRTQEKHHLLAVLQRLLPILARESIAGALWIVEESRIRIRA